MNVEASAARFEIPPHVDPAQVVDFDFFADRRYAEAGTPHEALIRLCDEIGRGIFWTPRYGGHWFINDHEMLFEAAKNAELFSSEYASYPPTPPEDEPYLPPITMDGANHMKFRVPLMRAFAPARIKALETQIRTFAAELIDAIKDKGECDFVDAVAEPLPIVTFMKLMGYDLSRRKEFREWASWMSKADVEKRLESNRRAAEMSRLLFEERRKHPQDDLLTELTRETIDGKPISQADLDGMVILLFGAGLDTVANSMAFGMHHVARNPELQDRLRADPSLISETIEELLRRYSVSSVARAASRDVLWHGARIKQGERVLLMLPTGNMDASAFPEPTRFDLEREDKTHMTFNSGPHRCVGSHLARLELNILYEEWLKRMPNVRLDPDKPAPVYRPGVVMEMSWLHLKW
jgi:cytochrome P450